MSGLSDQVALVTGASRGLGRGISIGLGEAHARVYMTARTLGPAGSSGCLASAAAEVSAAGGQPVVVQCDHRQDEQVAAVFTAIQREVGHLDLLVNNVTAVPELALLFGDTPFWDLNVEIWDDLFTVGLRSHFVASQYAARTMIKRRRGLIINISSVGAQVKAGVVPYGVAKAALDRTTADMAAELFDHGVAVLSLWPPPSTTEGMLAAAGPTDDIRQWSSPVLTGRVIAALATHPQTLARTGTALRVRDLADEFGIADTRDMS